MDDKLRGKIEANLAVIQRRIFTAAERAGRNPDEITLVAVTKSVGLAEMETLKSLGVQHFAENRVETARGKVGALDGVTWHMIGNLQRRKVRDAVQIFDTIDAVDRLSLAEAIQQRCLEQGRQMNVLLEVNVSGEDVKHGFRPEELPQALGMLQGMDRLRVRGLMTMAPYGAGEALLRQVFGGLRLLAAQHQLKELSMGMSNDFEIAVEEGATQVRIGSALFE